MNGIGFQDSGQNCARKPHSGLLSVLYVLVLVTLLFPTPLLASVRIGDIHAAWEDSVAVIQVPVSEPFSEEYQRALHSGLAIRFDFDIQLFRTGYSKRINQSVIVQYNVWTERYRITAPIGRLAIRDYQTVLKLFHDDLILIIDKNEIPYEGAWFVKVRTTAYPAGEDGNAGAAGSLERELEGVTGWIFRRGKQKSVQSNWSNLGKLQQVSVSGEKR